MADTNKAVASWILSRTVFGPDPSKVQKRQPVTQKPGIRGPMCLPGETAMTSRVSSQGDSGLHLLTGSRAPHSATIMKLAWPAILGAVSDLHGHTDGYRHGWFHRCRGYCIGSHQHLHRMADQRIHHRHQCRLFLSDLPCSRRRESGKDPQHHLSVHHLLRPSGRTADV